jgi:uncharacterized protein (TIGR02996 family)
MPDLMAIVSKAVFEKAAGKAPKVGAKLAMDRYVSANKNLESLSAGGKLYLVTVRPPDEALWLVAVLDQPHFDGKQWIAAPCDTPIVDISSLRTHIKFESGKGMSMAPGTLGMSLQTPRALTTEDVALLAGALDGAKLPPAVGALGRGIPAAPTTVADGDADRAAGLLANVIADPDNDLARQVYADELVTRNDPRGEYVQIALALNGPLSIRKRDALARRRAELVKLHGKTWWSWAKLTTRVERGFVEAVKGAFDNLASVASELFTKEPVVELDVAVGDLGKLLKAPWLPHIRRLKVRGIDDEGFATLVAAKACQQLQALNVSTNELSAEALASLKNHLPACRTLVLTNNAIGDEGIATLRTWKHLAHVEALYLSECELSSQGVAELIAAPLPALVKLTLTNNQLDDAVATAFATRAANLPALRVLELKGSQLTRVALETFQKSKLALVRLDLRRSQVSPVDVAALPFVRAGSR